MSSEENKGDPTLAQINTPSGGKIVNIENSSPYYESFKGLGAAFVPSSQELKAVEASYVKKIDTGDLADIFICRNPKTKTTWIIDIGIYIDSSGNQDRHSTINPLLESTSWDDPESLGTWMTNSDTIFVIDFEKLKSQGRSKICVVTTFKSELDKYGQGIVINEEIFGFDVEIGEPMFWIVKK